MSSEAQALHPHLRDEGLFYCARFSGCVLFTPFTQMYCVKDMLSTSEALFYETCLLEGDTAGIRFWQRIARKRYGGGIPAVDAH